MNDNSKAQTGIAVLLILVGALLLVQNLGLNLPIFGLIWAIVFAAGGLAFVLAFLTNRDLWWSLIPGFTLLGISGLITAGILFPRVAGEWGGFMFLLAISASFWTIYIVRRENWWAVIPGGILLTLAVVTLVGSRFEGLATGGVLFLGMAATFGLLYFLPIPEGRATWAIIPAGVLGTMAILLLLGSTSMLSVVWPVLLILLGLGLILRRLGRRS